MPPDSYQIEEVNPDWVLHPEDMGGKQKFWYLKPDESEIAWLFKYPRLNSGEHWAEKIAFEVSKHIEIPCAQVELAVFQGTRGSSSKSFISGNQQLFHGNQILARYMDNYDPVARRFVQSQHTLDNIWQALERVFEESEGSEAAKLRFAEFLVLDAVIGNIDRHHENWGVARRRTDDGEGWLGYLSPTFDHASSLGRELQDKRREGLLTNNMVGNYSEKGSGGIYWSESDSKAPSPLELVRLAYREYPNLLAPSLSKLAKLDEIDLKEIVEGIPPAWMSDTARRFAVRLISYNCKQLKELS